jgi:hypothetical protein
LVGGRWLVGEKQGPGVATHVAGPGGRNRHVPT